MTQLSVNISKAGNAKVKSALLEVATEVADKQSVTTLSNTHWDCECQAHYIHLNEDVYCPVCGSWRDESPDAIMAELANANNLLKPVNNHP